MASPWSDGKRCPIREKLLHGKARETIARRNFRCAVCNQLRVARSVLWSTSLIDAAARKPVCNPCHALALAATEPGPTQGPAAGGDVAPISVPNPGVSPC